MDEETDPNNNTDKIFAAKEAGAAYRNAMPMLAGQNGARDFIACAAHGILIGAIPKEDSGPVLYAAQVALSIAQSERRLPNPPAATLPKPASKCDRPTPPPAKTAPRGKRK
ncbi:MAG: hypothetical protein WBQ94_03015 [Terracidiphilus sp.]